MANDSRIEMLSLISEILWLTFDAVSLSCQKSSDLDFASSSISSFSFSGTSKPVHQLMDSFCQIPYCSCFFLHISKK